MSCPDCGSPEGSIAQLCSQCVERRKVAHAERTSQSKTQLESVSAGMNISFLLSFWKWGLILIGLAIIIAYRMGVFGFGTMKDVALNSTAGMSDPCANKSRCLIVFVAPWCPACQGSLSFVNFARDKLLVSRNTAIKVIVGSDSVTNLGNMARKIGGQVFLDPDGEFAREAGVSGVPAWWVIDGKKKIVARGTGLPGEVNEEMFNLMARERFKLSEHF